MSEWTLQYAPNLGIMSLTEPLFAHSVGSTDPVAQIEYLASLGFAGVEDNMLTLRPVADQARMAAALARLHMAMGCFVIGVSDAGKPLLASGRADHFEAYAAHFDTALAAAERMGGGYLVATAAAALGVPRPLQVANLTEGLRRLAEKAERQGVTVVFEAINAWEFPGQLVNDITEAFAIVSAVRSPAVKLVADIQHIQASTGDVLRNLDHIWSQVAVIQVSNNPNRTPLGDGEINYLNIFKYFVERGYDGLVELEYFIPAGNRAGEDAALEQLRAIDRQLRP